MKKTLIYIIAALLVSNNVYASDLSEWAEPEYEIASNVGMLSENILQYSLKECITREEFCELAINLFSKITDKEVFTPENTPFTDCANPKVAQAYALGIVSGKSETEFCPNENVTREEIAKILIGTLKAAEVNLITLRSEAEECMASFDDSEDISDWAYTEFATALKYSIISGMGDNKLMPKAGATREQAIAIISRAYNQFAENKVIFDIPEFISIAADTSLDISSEIEMSKIDGAKNYLLIIKDSTGKTVVTSSSKTNKIKPIYDTLQENMKYTFYAGVEFESGVKAFSLPIDVIYNHESKVITKINTDAGTQYDKAMRVFPGGIMFETEEEADAHMQTVTVDVWCINEKGEKYATKKSLTVNKYLADDVVKIFKEIFDDSSCFPIKSVGGYCWRNTAFGKPSQHSFGTCIDINPDENYYCYAENGEQIVGQGWMPYENVYSITPDGAVVAAFAKYGWIWGGSWTGTVKDYMHFSYLGK